jgi:hypothetical protein
VKPYRVTTGSFSFTVKDGASTATVWGTFHITVA